MITAPAAGSRYSIRNDPPVTPVNWVVAEAEMNELPTMLMVSATIVVAVAFVLLPPV